MELDSSRAMPATEVVKTVRGLEQSFGTMVIGFLAKRSRGLDSLTLQDVCDAISYGCSQLKGLPALESKPRLERVIDFETVTFGM